MSVISTNHESVGKVCKAFGLEHCFFLNINMKVDSLVTVTARFHATEEQMNEASGILKEFMLCEKDEDSEE